MGISYADHGVVEKATLRGRRGLHACWPIEGGLPKEIHQPVRIDISDALPKPIVGSVVAEVAAWGDVVAGRCGVRASHMMIRKVWCAGARSKVDGKLLSEWITSKYHGELEVTDEPLMKLYTEMSAIKRSGCSLE